MVIKLADRYKKLVKGKPYAQYATNIEIKYDKKSNSYWLTVKVAERKNNKYEEHIESYAWKWGGKELKPMWVSPAVK